jgi:hypothetical protein
MKKDRAGTRFSSLGAAVRAFRDAHPQHQQT